MPQNVFMSGAQMPQSPASTLSRKIRAQANAAMYGAPDVVDAYYYATPLRALAASGSDTYGIPIQADAEFVCEWISGILLDMTIATPEWRLGTGATQNATDGITNIVATVRITDTGSDRQIMNERCYWHNVIGTAQRPNYLAAPKHFRPNGVIQIDVTNLVAVAAQWQVVFGGVKIYRIGKS